MSNTADSYSPAATNVKGSLASDAGPTDNVDIGYPLGFTWVDTSGGSIWVSNGDGTWTENAV